MSRRPITSTEGTRAPMCLRCGAGMKDGDDRWWCRGDAIRHELEIVWPEDAPKSSPAARQEGRDA